MDDKRLKLAKQALESGSYDKETIEYIFPELKESEDERIREELMEFLVGKRIISNDLEGINIDKTLTWLEKQGEKINPYSGVSFEYNGHTWGMCARDYGVDITLDEQLFKHLNGQGDDNSISPKEIAKSIGKSLTLSLISYLDNNRYEGAMNMSSMECEDLENSILDSDWSKVYRYMQKKLEKQDGQKETPCDKCRKEQPSHSCQDIAELGRCALEHQCGQESTDNVGPKFKIGDLIKRKGKNVTFRIDRIQGGYYHCDQQYGSFFPIEEQDEWELIERKKTNLIDILKCYPKETRLFSPLCGYIWLAEVDEENGIITCYKNPLECGCTRATLGCEETISFYSDGTTGLPDYSLTNDCMLFLDMNRTPIDKMRPKFKIGDWIAEKDLDEFGRGIIVAIRDGKYVLNTGNSVSIKEQDEWELVKRVI